MSSKAFNKRPLFFLLALLMLFCPPAWASPVQVTDDAGNDLHLSEPPKRVVSLVPSATEILFAIGAGDSLVGITHHSTGVRGAAGKSIIGGFFSPSMERVMALNPDLVIGSDIHSQAIGKIDGDVPVLVMNTRRMEDAFRHMELLGTLFQRQAQADALIAKNRRQIDLIARKVAAIPEDKRKRVMRLMGRDRIMTPGSDSFQNEMIRAAGGIAPDFGKAGSVVPVTEDEWMAFNPQFLYGCGGDRQAAETFFSQDGWAAVDAVRQHRIYFFPCELTCRAGAHVGDFVSWLASLIYREEFSDTANEMLPRQVVQTRPLAIDLNCVDRARITTSIIQDFPNKSLIIDFKTPRSLVSTLEGQRSEVLTVGNHYSPPPCWALMPMGGLDPLYQCICPVIGKKRSSTAFLFTGADMDNLAVKKEIFKAMTVYALVTAGVRGNAVRMSRDVGNYYEPGTINMIFLTNMRLTPRAMTRAIISATEGKTAALQDLDIRSSYQPLNAAATGTGTDNIIVVAGDGPVIDNAGGHSKMGELIARTAYAGLREAIFKQNGIVGGRDIFQRLFDRHLSISQLVSGSHCDCLGEANAFAGKIEQVLLDPRYQGFLEAAMALSDGAERETVSDFGFYENWCLDVAGRIAGSKVDHLVDHFSGDAYPAPLSMALNAIFTGLAEKGEP
ncbi:hypothetical protein DSCW_15850 [Desulfosarcina widdelii]|uniref:Fe/B12 periplasmic-binding domain-containing protein n=1 Tax=Desulfosarcina widdelii TaxID=947919 RepID=A0A5K7YZW7_9BACT|nr:helical backbone metal receptor [Desulfosarcina widdelii]BBO74168.1 hypothetical protein DSCW_15850 [Desulfosarcina widdelii]